MTKLTAFCALLLLAGCVPQRQWRTESALSPAASAKAPLEKRFYIPPDRAENRAYSLSFVEFKNTGEPWDKRQLDEALRAIDEADRRSNHRALVITFIHGWKNNAREENNNVLDFRRQLNRIAMEACRGDIEHCGVAGVYFSWSGDIVAREWNTVRNLTYFNRRGIAAHVAAKPLSDALFDVMKQVKLGPDRTTNHSIIVGHSFGGLILEYAIHDRLKELGDELRAELGKAATRPEDRLKTLGQFADLVVLANQAAPADEAVTLLSEYRSDLQRVNILTPPRRHHCPAGDTSQDCKELTRPLVLSVSSESDLATRAVLPVAETISPPKNRPRTLPAGVKLPPGLDPKKVFTTAAAHTPQLYSHELVLCTNGDCSPCLKRDKFYIPVSITLPAYAPSNDLHHDQKLNYCLVRDVKAWNRTPYWIFHLPTAIVPDHGSIFTDRFTDFLTSFLPPLAEFMAETPVPPMRLTMAPEH